MSCNRENVVWKSPQGGWSIGFFDFYNVGDTSDPDWDYEWDVEYDFSRFNWASTGHATEQKAIDAWGGANPGGHTIISEGPECERYDKMVLEWRHHDNR